MTNSGFPYEILLGDELPVSHGEMSQIHSDIGMPELSAVELETGSYKSRELTNHNFCLISSPKTTANLQHVVFST